MVGLAYSLSRGQVVMGWAGLRSRHNGGPLPVCDAGDVSDRCFRELVAVCVLGTAATGVGLVLGAAVVRLVAGPHASGWWPIVWIAAIAVPVTFVAGLLSDPIVARWASRTSPPAAPPDSTP